MTPPKFTDELAAWTKKQNQIKPRQNRHTVAFLAVKEDIKSAIDAGYAMKTIWKFMCERGQIDSRYETFTMHVKRYITSMSDAMPTPPQKNPKKIKEKVTESTRHEGFKFNSVANEDELF